MVKLLSKSIHIDGDDYMNLCCNFDKIKHKCIAKEIDFSKRETECPYQKSCNMFKIETLEDFALALDTEVKSKISEAKDYSRELFLELSDNTVSRDIVMSNTESDSDNIVYGMFGFTFVVGVIIGVALSCIFLV